MVQVRYTTAVSLATTQYAFSHERAKKQVDLYFETVQKRTPGFVHPLDEGNLNWVTVAYVALRVVLFVHSQKSYLQTPAHLPRPQS